MERQEAGINLVDWSDSGWVGADDHDDLDAQLEAEEEPVDEREPHVMTALGPIEPAALGLTLVGAWGASLVGPNRAPGTALLELEQLYATGIRAVVDLDPEDTAARRADLAWLSARSPVHILTAAGVASNADAGDETQGVQIRPGLRLLMTGADKQSVAETSHLPVFVDLAGLAGAPAGLGVAATRDVQVTAVADPLAMNAEVVQTVLDAGARLVMVASDDVATMPDAAAWFKQIADAGFIDRLALGYAGDPIMVMERMPIFLMEAGLTSVEVRQILIDNPLQSLLISGSGHAPSS